MILLIVYFFDLKEFKSRQKYWGFRLAIADYQRDRERKREFMKP